MGNKICLDKTPKCIISLVPSQTELLFDLGLTDEVVGITKFCVHPEEMFRKKPRVGGTKKVNFDKIKELQPDLIIGNKEENEKEQILELMKHYPVWMSDIKTLDDAYQMIISVGEIIGRRKKSEELVKKIKSEFEKLKQLTNNQPAYRTGRQQLTKSVAYFIWKNPYMCAGLDTFIDNMLSLCGFENVFKTHLQPFSKEEESIVRYPKITVDDIKKANPGLIFLSSEPYPFKEKHIQEFKSICPDADVRVVDGEMFSWYGSRLLHAPKYFSGLLKQL